MRLNVNTDNLVCRIENIGMMNNRDVSGIMTRVTILCMISTIIVSKIVNNSISLEINITYIDVSVQIPTVTGNGIILTIFLGLNQLVVLLILLKMKCHVLKLLFVMNQQKILLEEDDLITMKLTPQAPIKCS